jgi:short-subunit dehydrogenase
MDQEMSKDVKQVRKTVLITGASSGIGLELARLFARNGYNLLLVARNADRLGEVAKELQSLGVDAKSLAVDLADPTAPQAIYDLIRMENVAIDVLVNNAGFGSHGFFHENDQAVELSMIQVNVVALTHLTRLFLPDLVKRGEGKVLNVASTASFQPGPLMAVYYATKAYVLSFTEAIAEELRGTGVTATALCPGPTLTGFQSRAGAREMRMLKGGLVLDATIVAKVGYDGLMAGKTLVIPGFRNRILSFGVRFTPRRWVTRIARRMNET